MFLLLMCCVCIWCTTSTVLTTVRVFVAGTAGVTVAELQSSSVDGGQRSVPTNVEPLAKRRKLTEEVATESNLYSQTQTVSISLDEYQGQTVSHSRVHLYYYCTALPSTAHVVYAIPSWPVMMSTKDLD